MRRLGASAWALLAGLVSGCGSAPPLPAERHYRLPPPAASHRLARAPRIERVWAPGPLRERPLLWSDDDHGLVLQQQHYHSWVAPPPDLVRRHLRSCLGAADLAPAEGGGGWRLSLELERFERVMAADRVAVAVAVAVAGHAGERRLARRYVQLLPVAGRDVATAVPVFAAALDAICSELAADLGSASVAGR